MPRRSPHPRECARALWLLGLTPPVTADELTRAWRARVARAHPDRHAGSTKEAAAASLTRALNEAKAVVATWIASGREWPDAPAARRPAASPPASAERDEPREAPVCPRTGLRAGDVVRLWPYAGDELHVVAGTVVDAGAGRVWVRLAEGGSARAERVRLAAFACPVCGICAGPAVPRPALRPCPECLVDVRRLERRPEEAARVRSGIEARAEAGRAAARTLDDERLAERAEARLAWARRLRSASEGDLHAALLAAFGRAFERWSAPAA